MYGSIDVADAIIVIQNSIFLAIVGVGPNTLTASWIGYPTNLWDPSLTSAQFLSLRLSLYGTRAPLDGLADAFVGELLSIAVFPSRWNYNSL